MVDAGFLGSSSGLRVGNQADGGSGFMRQADTAQEAIWPQDYEWPAIRSETQSQALVARNRRTCAVGMSPDFRDLKTTARP